MVDQSKYVQEFSRVGAFIKKFPVIKDAKPQMKVRLSCIAIEQKKVDNCMYVGDCEPSQSCVYVLTEEGEPIRTVEVSIPPMFLAVNKEGQVLVTGDNSPKVLSVQMSQGKVADLAPQEFAVENAVKVTGVAWDAKTGGYFVAVQQEKRGQGRIDRYTFSGDYDGNVVGPGLVNPLGLALSPTGTLVVADKVSIKLL